MIIILRFFFLAILAAMLWVTSRASMETAVWHSRRSTISRK